MSWLLQRQVLFVIQTVSSVLMVTLILMQNKGTGLSSTFGGDGTFYRSKRGVEKIVGNLTIACAVCFVVFSFLTLYAN